MSKVQINTALQGMYKIAINALEELKLNSNPVDFALFCDETEQMVQEAFQISRNGRRPQLDHSVALTNNYSGSLNSLPPPTFKKPLPMKCTQKNQNTRLPEKNVSKISEFVTQNKGKNKAKRIPAAVAASEDDVSVDDDDSDSEDESEPEYQAPVIKKKINKQTKNEQNMTKKPPVKRNEKKSSVENESTIEESATSKKRQRQSLNQESKMEDIEADFVLKDWTLILNHSQLVLKGDKYNRALKLLESNFITPSIKSANKVLGKFVVTANKTTFLLIESKMKNDAHIPDEVKELCNKEFPKFWRKCLKIWNQIEQTQNESKNDPKKVAEPKQKKPEPKKGKNAPNPQQNKKNAKKATEQQKKLKTAPEPEKNGKSIFEKMMDDDSFDNGNCMTPSALLNSIKKSNVSAGTYTPPSNFLRELQSTSVFERSVMSSEDKKDKQKCKVIDRMTKDIQKKRNVVVKNQEINVGCEKVDFDKILPNVQETSTFCSESELSSIED